MIIEIAVSVIAIAMVFWMSFMVVLLSRITKRLDAAERDINKVSGQAAEVLQKTDGLITDIKSITDAALRPKGSSKKGNGADALVQALHWATDGLALFQSVKKVIKHYEK